MDTCLYIEEPSFLKVSRWTLFFAEYQSLFDKFYSGNDDNTLNELLFAFDLLQRYWFPELSIYREPNQAKVLFGSELCLFKLSTKVIEVTLLVRKGQIEELHVIKNGRDCFERIAKIKRESACELHSA